MTKDQAITLRIIDNGWVASFHTASPYKSGEFYAKTAKAALALALKSLDQKPDA